MQSLTSNNNIEEEWENVKTYTFKSLRKKRKFKTKWGLRIWNNKMSKAIEKKKKTYNNIYLEKQKSYKNKKKAVKTLIKVITIYKKFISYIKDNIHRKSNNSL